MPKPSRPRRAAASRSPRPHPPQPRGARAAPAAGRARVPEGRRSVGVIFVHGIGTQPARETFLNWSNAIVEMLAEWRRGHDADAPGSLPLGENPVQTGAVECDDGCGERAWARIAIPETEG